MTVHMSLTLCHAPHSVGGATPLTLCHRHHTPPSVSEVPHPSLCVRDATPLPLCRKCCTPPSVSEVPHPSLCVRGTTPLPLCRRCHTPPSVSEVPHPSLCARDATPLPLCRRCHTPHSVSEVPHPSLCVRGATPLPLCVESICNALNTSQVACSSTAPELAVQLALTTHHTCSMLCSNSLCSQPILNCVLSAERFKEWICNGRNAAESKQMLEHAMEGVRCVYVLHACLHMFMNGCLHLRVWVCMHPCLYPCACMHYVCV